MIYIISSLVAIAAIIRYMWKNNIDRGKEFWNYVGLLAIALGVYCFGCYKVILGGN